MITLPIGLFASIFIVILSVEGDLWSTFGNLHSVVIVFGGTLGIFFISTPISVIKALGHSLVEMIKPIGDFSHYWQEVQQLSQTRELKGKSRNTLINYAVDLWESGTSSEMFIVLISQKRTELEQTGTDAVQALKNLSKYPPALGMTGTVIGLVGLFSKLGGGNREVIGPSLAMALTATFFGLIVANFLLMPLADRLLVQHLASRRTLMATYRALILINRNESLELIAEEKFNESA